MNLPTRSTGRPGSALLILCAIFTTAVMLRLPVGPSPAKPELSPLPSSRLVIWSAPPLASMDRPSMTPQLVTMLAVDASAPPEPVEVATLAASSEFPRHDIARRELARSEIIPQPQISSSTGGSQDLPLLVGSPSALFSTMRNQTAGLAASVTPVSSIEPPSVPTVSQPFSAVGTAFAKTGAALALAFKKTGQGILAPF